MKIKGVLLIFIGFFYAPVLRATTQPILSYSFNNHEIKEDNDRLPAKPVAVTMCEDRFGNYRSAIMVHGNASSYLNLGTNPMLKQKVGSISLWAKLDERVYAGKGVDALPIIITKRFEGDDFYISYSLDYVPNVKRIAFGNGLDSINQNTIIANDTLQWKKWYHYVIAWDYDYSFLYVNGLLQAKSKRGYTMEYLPSDSVVLGITANKKNYRAMLGAIDDIAFYDRVLTGEEVLALYKTPNPNRLKSTLAEIGKYAAIILFFIIVIVLIVLRYRQVLKRQKGELELRNKISDLELKVVKSQMNPHFISNSLAAIQELVLTHQNDKAAQYLAKFSYYLRQVLYVSDKNFIPLATELELIKLNVELEQLRFSNRFEFELLLDPDIDIQAQEIPALITQPFIENAIWHGLLPLADSRPPQLTIRVSSTANGITLDIADNGVGRQNKEARKDRRSMGTKLISDKIASLNNLMTNSYCKLAIIDLLSTDNQPIGTRVTLTIKTQNTHP